MSEATSSLGSVISIADMTADLFRHLAQAAFEDFGSEAKEPLWAGLRRYGRWHGTKVTADSISDLVQRWPTPEVRLAMLSDELGHVRATNNGAWITLRYGAVPRPLVDDSVPEFVRAAYLEAPIEGIAEAVGTFSYEIEASVNREMYEIRIIGRGSAHSGASVLGEESGEGDQLRMSVGAGSAARALQIETMRCRGAMFVCVARALIDRFDAAGERAVRTATRRYATLRGQAARAKHLAEGVELNLKNFVDDYDNPMSVWGWEDNAILTPGRWHANCNFCPHVSAWRELDELELGYIYDYEVHVSLFTSYEPETRVQWDELQSRGDATCQFRFEIPRLLGPAEEAFGGHPPIATADADAH